MKCPKCGFVSFPNLTYCKKCGVQFVPSTRRVASSSPTILLPGLLTLSLLILLTSLYDALPVLGTTIFFGALLLMFVMPEIATLVVAFVLYSNLAIVGV